MITTETLNLLDFDLDIPIIETATALEDLEEVEKYFGVKNQGLTKRAKQKGRTTGVVSLKEKLKEEVKAKLKSRIKTVNASLIREFKPKQGEFCFFLMSGNCEFVDYINVFVTSFSEKPVNIFITTLSLNEKTFDSLDQLSCQNDINVLVSSYFLATDTKGVLPNLYAKNRLDNYNVGFYRNHTKIVLIEFSSSYFVFTGSANLRSSGTIEQFTIFNSKELFDFNKRWIEKLIKKYNYKENLKEAGGKLKETNTLATLDFLEELGDFEY